VWTSSEVIVAKACNPCVTAALPSSAAEDADRAVAMDTGSVMEVDSQSLSLPDIFFNYSDLVALKTCSPPVTIWRRDINRPSDFTDSYRDFGYNSRELGSDLRGRGDEMNAVLRCLELAGNVVTKRVRMSEHLFSQETRGIRPASTEHHLVTLLLLDVWND